MQTALESVAHQLCEVLAQPLGDDIVEVTLQQPFKAEKFAWDTAKAFDAQLRRMKGAARFIASVCLMHPEQIQHAQLQKFSKETATWLEIKHVKGGRRILVVCLKYKLYVARA